MQEKNRWKNKLLHSKYVVPSYQTDNVQFHHKKTEAALFNSALQETILIDYMIYNRKRSQDQIDAGKYN